MIGRSVDRCVSVQTHREQNEMEKKKIKALWNTMAVKIQTNWDARSIFRDLFFLSTADLDSPWKHNIRKFDSNQNNV